MDTSEFANAVNVLWRAPQFPSFQCVPSLFGGRTEGGDGPSRPDSYSCGRDAAFQLSGGKGDPVKKTVT